MHASMVAEPQTSTIYTYQTQVGRRYLLFYIVLLPLIVKRSNFVQHGTLWHQINWSEMSFVEFGTKGILACQSVI